MPEEEKKKIDRNKDVYILPMNLKKPVTSMRVKFEIFKQMVRDSQVQYYTQEGWKEWEKILHV